MLGLTSGVLLFILVPQIEAVPNGGYKHAEILIQPEELKALVDRKDSNLRVVDVRETPVYLMGHIPGAVQIWRSDMEDKNHRLPGMMAPREQMESVLGKVGISDKNTIVLYSDLYDHARLWWILAYYGFPIRQMKLLDGGIEGWKRKGYSLDMLPPAPKKVTFLFPGKNKTPSSILCTLSDVRSALKAQGKIVLDVRSRSEYLGEETKKGALKPGRIPGVTWIEWKEAVVQEGPWKDYWKPAEEINKIFGEKGVTPDKDIYFY